MLVTISDYKTDKVLKQPFNDDGRLPMSGDPIRFEINGVNYEGYVREVEHVYTDHISTTNVTNHGAIVFVNVTNIEDVIVAPKSSSSIEFDFEGLEEAINC